MARMLLFWGVFSFFSTLYASYEEGGSLLHQQFQDIIPQGEQGNDRKNTRFEMPKMKGYLFHASMDADAVCLLLKKGSHVGITYGRFSFLKKKSMWIPVGEKVALSEFRAKYIESITCEPIDPIRVAYFEISQQLKKHKIEDIDINLLRFLINKFPQLDLNIDGYKGRNILGYFAFKGNVEDLKTLLTRKNNCRSMLKLRGHSNYVPLLYAASSKKAANVEYLLQQGADLFQKVKDQQTVISFIAKWNDHEVIDQLLKRYWDDASVKTRILKHIVEAQLASDFSYREESLLERAVDLGLDLTEQAQKDTLLYHFVLSQNTKYVRKLLEAGVSPDEYSEGKTLPLVEASYMGSDDIVKLLLDAGADPSLEVNEIRKYRTERWRPVEPCYKELNALEAASLGGHEKVIDVYLNEKSLDDEVRTRMLEVFACREFRKVPKQSDMKFVEKLATYGLDPNYKYKDRTLLTYFSTQDNFQFTEQLLKAGANPNTHSKNNLLALSEATYTGNVKMVNLLLKYGADPLLPAEKSRGTNKHYSSVEWGIFGSKKEVILSILKSRYVAKSVKDKIVRNVFLSLLSTYVLPDGSKEIILQVIEEYEAIEAELEAQQHEEEEVDNIFAPKQPADDLLDFS